MKKSLLAQPAILVIGIVVCLASLLLPCGAQADGTSGDPPSPVPTDSTFTVQFVPDQSPETSVATGEQSLWEEVLTFLTQVF